MNLLRFLLGWFFRLLFNTQLEQHNEKDPFILIPNHVMLLDPVVIGMTSKQHMYFVASDHLMRKGFASKLLEWVFQPIMRTKGSTDAHAAMSILRTVKKGYNVCIFAEGSTTFNGLSGPIYRSTGKLVKSAGVKLITYRLSGGYFTRPRWGEATRRGLMTGKVAGIYSAEEIKAMTEQEVDAVIVRDIHEDAYATQTEHPVAFKGKRLAEFLESAAYLCPCCNEVGHIHSNDNRVWCDCGMEATMDVFGFLRSETLPYTTVRDWDLWQMSQVDRIIGNLKEKPLLEDGARLLDLKERKKTAVISEGALILNDTDFACGAFQCAIADISDIGIVGRNNLMLTTGGEHYQVRFDRKNACGKKYFDVMSKLIKGE